MQRHHRASRAFTLVEMLVVITIIGILVALLVPVLSGVVKNTKNSAIAVEVQDLAKAMETYKSKHGEYPPDFSNDAIVRAHLRQAFPRISPSSIANFTNAMANFDAAEALVFWLRGLKKNPLDPLGQSAAAAKVEFDVLFQFDEARLRDQDNDGLPEYYSKYATEMPYVYFDGRVFKRAYPAGTNPISVYAYATTSYPFESSPNPPYPRPKQNGASNVVRPFRTNERIDIARDNGRTWPIAQPNAGDNLTTWLSPGGFQIICAGQDNLFGNDIGSGATFIFKQFPRPDNYTLGDDADNIASFSEMKTFEAAVP